MGQDDRGIRRRPEQVLKDQQYWLGWTSLFFFQKIILSKDQGYWVGSIGVLSSERKGRWVGLGVVGRLQQLR